MDEFVTLKEKEAMLVQAVTRAEAAERKYNSVIEEMKESNKLIGELQRENRELKAGVFADEMGKKARELLIDRDAMKPVVDAAVKKIKAKWDRGLDECCGNPKYCLEGLCPDEKECRAVAAYLASEPEGG